LLLDTMTGATVIPSAAVERGSPGTFVYLVKPDNTVSAQKVTLGPSSGEKVAVTAGLQPGDKVVVDGADKLSDGAKVRLVAAKPPAKAAAAASTPTDPRKARQQTSSDTSRAPSEPLGQGPQFMSPSRPFILRPVATSLLMAAIMLVGFVG